MHWSKHFPNNRYLMFVEKTYLTKFARQNLIKAEKFAQQNSYFQALGGGVLHPPPPEVTPCIRFRLQNKIKQMRF